MEKQPLFIISGKVVHGKGKGKTVGMPTANLEWSEILDLPELGVYASKIQIEDKWYIGVTNVGFRPSVDNEKSITIETFIFDFHQDIYGYHVVLELYMYIRETTKMKSLNEVQEQVKKDCESARRFFSGSL
ncbi:MAG: riboflavin kinase [Lachnospiraceae bacterium]